MDYCFLNNLTVKDTDTSSNNIGNVQSQFQWWEEQVLTSASSHLTVVLHDLLLSATSATSATTYWSQNSSCEQIMAVSPGFSSSSALKVNCIVDLKSWAIMTSISSTEQGVTTPNTDAMSIWRTFGQMWLLIKHWSSFEEDAADVVLLAVTLLKPGSNKPVETSQSPAHILEQTVINWLKSRISPLFCFFCWFVFKCSNNHNNRWIDHYILPCYTWFS